MITDTKDVTKLISLPLSTDEILLIMQGLQTIRFPDLAKRVCEI
jgi:hypothetical protein